MIDARARLLEQSSARLREWAARSAGEFVSELCEEPLREQQGLWTRLDALAREAGRLQELEELFRSYL